MTLARRLVAAAAVCALLIGAPSAAAGTRVVFTVDAESNEFRLVDQMNAVCADGSACGVMEIVRLLRERRWSGTFFLNVFEHRQWGETAMRDIAIRLQGAGQDVALHTHPQWGYDPSRRFMHQYGLEEQTTIVRDGVRLLEAWTGLPVVAHRAGAYAADERTLVALQRNGVRIDSSLWWQDPQNRFDALGLSRNLPSRYAGVVEIPVTAYQREDRPRYIGRVLGPVTAMSKIDPNWFTSAGEARDAIDGVLAANVPVLVVFLHSFSFMTAPSGGGPPVADRHALDMFRLIADQVASHRLPVVTMRDIAGDMPAVPAPELDVVPRVSVSVDFPHYAWHRTKQLDRVSLLMLGLGLASLCAAALLGLARRRSAAEGRTGQGGAALAARTRVEVQ
jgi:peptidoglycan/xylan/chitin deacetylase (PgdA/CDA1 family)